MLFSAWIPNPAIQFQIQFQWTTSKCPIALAMDSFYIYIFSAAVSFVGRRLISLGGDKACAYLNVHTLHRILDIDLNQCILSLAGMNAMVCALTDFFRNWESKQPSQIVNANQLRSPLKHSNCPIPQPQTTRTVSENEGMH